jgi:hypothetical protein
VPAEVEFPNVNKLVAVVLIFPANKFKVPLIDIGTFNVTPVELELLITNSFILADGDEVEFLKIPVPDIVCVFATARPEA